MATDIEKAFTDFQPSAIGAACLLIDRSHRLFHYAATGVAETSLSARGTVGLPITSNTLELWRRMRIGGMTAGAICCLP